MQVKCTSCGASQNISQAQNCDFCGNLIELESAKTNYQSFLNGESGNLMSMAETAIEATNWEEALQYFNRVLEKDITTSDAWLGKGIAIVYTSKIGELKINEAIAYWKNAVKHASNEEAMGKRVAKEINEVVNKFYPSLENHFIQFKDLDNSYGELVSKFVTLEAALEYAVELDPMNVLYSKSGYNLCKRVIAIPKSHALADSAGAMADAIIGGLQGNKYAQNNAISKSRKATELKNLINRAALIIIDIEKKYTERILSIEPDNIEIRNAHNAKENLKKVNQEKELKAKKLENKNLIYNRIIWHFVVCFGILGLILIPTLKNLAPNLTSDQRISYIFIVSAILTFVIYKKRYPAVKK